MGRLVRHDVVRQGREHQRARRIEGVLGRDREVAKQQCLLRRAVVGVSVAQRVRVDPQPAHELIDVIAGAFHDLTIGPQRDAAQRALEVANGGHRHGVDHLLVKLRIGFRRGEAVLGQQIAVVEIHGTIEEAARRIAVDDFDVFTDGAGLQILPRHFDGDFVDGGGLEPRHQARIERENAQPPRRGALGHDGRSGERRSVHHLWGALKPGDRIQFAVCAARVMAPTLSGDRNWAGEMVPAFIWTKPSIAARLPWMAPNSCCISGGGGSSVASRHVNSYIGITCSSRRCWYSRMASSNERAPPNA